MLIYFRVKACIQKNTTEQKREERRENRRKQKGIEESTRQRQRQDCKLAKNVQVDFSRNSEQQPQLKHTHTQLA